MIWRAACYFAAGVSTTRQKYINNLE